VSEKCAIGRGLAALEPDDTDLKYCFYLLSNFKHKFLSYSQGTTFEAINRDEIAKIKVPFTQTLTEQKKIGSIISKVDELIQKTDQIIEQTQRLKNGLMERLLTKGIGHTKFKDTKIGNIPDSWRLDTTADIFSYVTSGSRDWAKYYSDSGPILIRITNLDHESIDLDLRETKHVSLPAGIEGTRTRVIPNDIVVSITADVGMVAVIPASFPEAYVNQHVALIRLKEGYNARFLARYISWNKGGLRQLIQMQRGVTKVGLGLDDIKNIIVPIPAQNEQQEIVSKLDCVECALTLNYQHKKMTEHLKRGLMQNLLIGKIRVKL
jgi:type I restriction enzyme S subunit